MTSLHLLPMNTNAIELYKNTIVSDEDTGFDLYCVQDEVIKPNALCHKIKLGVATALMDEGGKRIGYMLVPRSSTCKRGIRQSNSVGIIDAGYNNEICVMVDNVKNNECKLKKGDRLFQVVQYSGLPIKDYSIVDSLPSSKRNMGGFGSTGTDVMLVPDEASY
jgi:dUTP pyrophosphatase